MTEKEIKMQLLSIYGGSISDARKALEFVNEGSRENVSDVSKDVNSKDGVYLIYSDGHSELFNHKNSKDNVRYIGLCFDGHYLAVALKDAGYCQLVKGDFPKDNSWNYKDREWKAIEDWDGKGNTEHLRENGLNSEIKLKEWEYIPASGQQLFMDKHLEKLNEALLYVGGDPIKMDNWYWSSSGYNASDAWLVIFGSGGVGSSASRTVIECGRL
jgi:hypothetical protein